MECGFRFHVDENISRLAWCAVLERGKCADVYCGAGVACVKDTFVEGAWNGSYADMDFERAGFLCGSGGKIIREGGERYCFATPDHVLEKLVIVRKDGRLFVSNSVPFVLARSGCRLDMQYAGYERDFSSILNGLDGYKREIPLAEGMTLSCYYYCNLFISPQGDITAEEKQRLHPVHSYEDYMTALLSDMRKLRDNAKDAARRNRYGLVTTVSSGYDAAACSAIAKRIGCETALTFDRPQKYAEDCGDKVAERLGYRHIIKEDANAYLSREDLVEAEHVCSGELGTSIIFSAFEQAFRDNLVFYGERGDKLWNKNWPTPNDRFVFEGEMYAGISMCEARLRIGFVLVPMPLYKAAVWTSIHALSNAPEMAAWSVGGRYDRPIPRRMVEEAGVERELFGQKKKGAGFNYHYDTLKRLKSRMSEASYDSFVRYYRTHRRQGQTARLLRYYWKSAPDYLNYLFRKLGIKKRIAVHDRQFDNPGAPSYLINWGMEILTQRYLEAQTKQDAKAS
ncbi:MAG: hypothetical protein K2N81_00390 [Acetatifactor sp.]|nr:hypothetical protein [Acetatifactor sp.]